MTGSSQHQTLSFLMRRFREAGVRPRTTLGQNFLIDLNLLRVLLDAAELDRHDVVLEVGTGTASLTVHMAQRAAAVVTVEIDRQLYQLASEELINYDNVTMLSMDALKGKNHLNPEVVATVERHLAAEPDRRFKLVANLPYQVATPLIMNLLMLDRPPSAMVVTIQKELADRIVAEPGSKDYGALSIWVQSQCRVELVRILPPSVFWPRPKVTSAILRITLDPALRNRIADRSFFHAFVRSMFMHRRKLLRFELCSAFADRLDKPGVDRLMAEMGFGPESRAEQLDVDTMLALSERLGDIPVAGSHS
jgi:16S rRNA (adenine1518-N6/adenine1519-N6)-dimethyltransferase